MSTAKQEYPHMAECFGLYDKPATAANIRRSCRELVSHPGRYQGLTAEEAYYTIISEQSGEPIISVEIDDFEIWRSGTLCFVCVTDDNGFACVQRFNDFGARAAAEAWYDAWMDAIDPIVGEVSE